MSKIQDKFKELKSRNEKALISYIMTGFPNENTTMSIVRGLVKGGADIIDLKNLQEVGHGVLNLELDISMKEGNSKEWQLEGGIGLISSRLTLQGPIKKDVSSFIISGRRTYADLFIPLFASGEKGQAFKGTGYYFFDLNTKINYILSDKDRLFLSGYFWRNIFDIFIFN